MALSIFIWTVGLAYYSYYKGFDDGEPATWLSLFLMLVCLALLLPATWDARLEPAKRKMARILSLITVAAMLDERFEGHETFGRFVRANVTSIPKEILFHTDDVIIVIGAIIGGILLYRCVRSVADKRGYTWYLFWVIVVAVSHGVLDVLGHGKYVWRAVLHEPSPGQIEYWDDTISYFEESCKLWTEWFLILFLLAFFYRYRSGLLWSAQVFVSSMLAVVGIWAVENAVAGVPYVWISGPLRYIRNYHLLLALSLIWIAWSLIVWRRYGADQRARNVAGLFLLSPFYLLLPRIAALADTPFGLLGFSFEKLAGPPLQLLAVGGILFPVAVFFVLREGQAKGLALAAAFAAAAVIHNPLWLLGMWAVFLVRAIDLLGARQGTIRRRTWAGLVAAQIVSILFVFGLALPEFVPNYRYRPAGLTFLETGHQPVARD